MLISCENCQSFMFMVYIFCEQHVCTKVHMHVHPTNSKWQLIHQRMSSFKSSVLYLSADFPFLSLHAYLLSDPPLCVVYTLHLLFSSLFSFPLYLFYMSGKKSLSFDFYFPLPSSSNLVTRRWQVRKRKGACEKWGLYSCCSTLSSSYMPPLLPEGWVCRTYLRKKESGKNAQRRSERWYRTAGNKNRRERVRKWFFFEGLSGHVEWEKRRDMRREEECGGVRSVYLPKESDSRLPANNPFLLLHFSESFCVLFCLSPYFSPSLSPRACFQKRPCQFTVTLHHLFSLFLIFLFHLPAFPFSIKYTWAFAGRPVFLSFLSLSNILWCFLPPLSQHFILTFQNQGALSLQEKCLNCTHDVGLIHVLDCVCVCLLPCFYWRMCVGHLFHEVFWCPEASLRRAPFISSALCCQLLTTVILLSRECLHCYICVCLHEFGIVHTWTRINNWLRWKCSHYRH